MGWEKAKEFNENTNVSSAKAEAAPICRVKIEYWGRTNTMWYGLYYSLKNNKWIKGFFEGSRASGYIHYTLYPGRYIRCDIRWWSKADPEYSLTCREIVLVPEGEVCREVEEASAGAGFNTRESGIEYFTRLGLPMVADFIAWAPGYHSRPSVDFTKVYTKEDTEKFLNWIRSGSNWIEGAEHE